MALGIKRETLGDILVGDGTAVIFALPTACEIIVRELTRAGNVGVSVLRERPDALPQVRTEALEGVAASLRLDCIVAMMTKASRSDAAALIRAGKVTCSGQIVTQGTFAVTEGMRISIRGTGKFVFRSAGAQTRSGRYHIQYEKYI
jgi:RNA-binding protein YlmH